ncbi:hypothetical protein WKW79_36900 [Variovorax robiniae]|uniref:Uncharacterized protein n=1 Tax=Variovorax robiniae TaxID=1836199 RepID=A0ABU8XM16_9BURK
MLYRRVCALVAALMPLVLAYAQSPLNEITRRAQQEASPIDPKTKPPPSPKKLPADVKKNGTTAANNARPRTLCIKEWIDSDCQAVCGSGPTKFAPPPSPGYRASGNDRAYILLEPKVYQVGTTEITIMIPTAL